ncbi:MAG: alanyl-tRNA editing protein [Pseudomonadota bacterium]
MSQTTAELFRDDAYARRCDVVVVDVVEHGVVLDQTVFYPKAGGQPGDTGQLLIHEREPLDVVDTLWEDERLVHRLAEGTLPPAVGDRAEALLDWPRRHRLMRMHSALHLLCKAVDAAVTGGQIGADRSRLDFAITGEVPGRDEVSATLCRWVAEDLPISHRWVDAAALDEQPDLVRTMSVKPPRTGGRVRLVAIEGVDLQACGGTHVARTGEIGSLAVVKIESKGKLNRRFTIALTDDEPVS